MNSRYVECYSEAHEGVYRTTVGLMVAADGTILQQAHVDKVILRVFRSAGRTHEDRKIYTADLAASDVIFDDLQDDDWWDDVLGGGDGYNFRHTLEVGDDTQPGLGQCTLKGGETYEIEYEFVKFEGGPVFAIHHARVMPIMSR